MVRERKGEIKHEEKQAKERAGSNSSLTTSALSFFFSFLNLNKQLASLSRCLFLPPNSTTNSTQGLLSATVQDAIMGGAVLATAGAAAWAVGRGDAPEGCSLCQGTGGCSCFACSGSGGNPSSSTSNSSSSLPPLTMEEVTAAREENDPANGKPSRRDFFGRAPRRVGARGAGLQCRVCGGTGLVLCSQCKGSGFTRI